MRQTTAIAAVLACLVPCSASAREEAQPWPTLNLDVSLGNGWHAAGEAIARTATSNGAPEQAEVRALIGRAVTKRLTLWIGVGRIENIVSGARNPLDRQVFEQVNWTVGRTDGARLMLRTRLEERVLRGSDELAWRLRQQVRGMVPIVRGGPSAVAWVEPFYSLNRTDHVPRGIDQVRSFVGVGLPITRHIAAELGYLRQDIHRVGPNLRNDAIPLILTVRL